MPGWWEQSNSVEVLGKAKECFQELARHCLLQHATTCRNTIGPRATTLQVLSLSDGSINEPENVPSSVLLAHAFATLELETWPAGLERVKIFGADVANPLVRRCDQQTHSWMPPWLELQHVCLDNQKNFKPQLRKCGLSEHSLTFDVVFMRQGLCYCQDRSFHHRPPEALTMSGIEEENISSGPSGTYFLERFFRHGRPSYRKGGFLLHWRPQQKDWVLEDSRTGYVWANVCKDCGSPALALEAWFKWNGKDFVTDGDVSCTVTGTCPWRCPASDCKCCAGISMCAATMHIFMTNVANVLNKDNPQAFAYLLGGLYTGTSDEVEGFYLEVEKATDHFNLMNSDMCAHVLRRQEDEDTEDDPARYWNQIHGLLLSTH